MKKYLSMALTVVMMALMCVTAFAADGTGLPDQLPDDTVGPLNVVINFVAEILRAIGSFIGIIFK